MALTIRSYRLQTMSKQGCKTINGTSIQTGYKRHYVTIHGYPLLYMAIYSKKSQHAYINTYVYFTITVEILERSLANFVWSICGQTHQFQIRATRQRARAINSTIRYRKNKLMSVFNESVLLLAMNFVKTLSK